MTYDQASCSAYLIETHGGKTTWTLIGKAVLDVSGKTFAIELADGSMACRILICPDTTAVDRQIDLFPVAHFVLADTISVSVESDVAFSASLSDAAAGDGHSVSG